MPHRGLLHSPQRSKHKKRSRSNSPKRHKRSRTGEARASDPNRDEVRVKQERHDPGYERYAGNRGRPDGASFNERHPSNHLRRLRGDNQQRREHSPNNQRADYGRVKEEKAPVDKQQPNFEQSGKLTEDTNTYRGVVIKYNEPAEARIPKRRWRLYVFKGDEGLPMLHLHRQSAYLLGRDRRIADIPIDHPSCSKQHAVFQYRLVDYTRPDGSQGKVIKPYLIDLGSSNGSFINGDQIEAQRYYELRVKDVVKFGFSSREYVIMHDAVNVNEEDLSDAGADDS